MCPPSLIRVFAVCSKGSHAPKLSGRTCHFVGFVVAVVVELIFTALQHFSGHFEHDQSTYPHCSLPLAILLGSLPVLSAHSFVSN